MTVIAVHLCWGPDLELYTSSEAVICLLQLCFFFPAWRRAVATKTINLLQRENFLLYSFSQTLYPWCATILSPQYSVNSFEHPPPPPPHHLV
jgi:hypothetical protein